MRCEPVTGWEDYLVSEDGTVTSTKGRGAVLSPWLCRGYKQVNFTSGGKRKHFHVHRLVAEAFIPNPDNLPEVNHIDENKLNNEASNLEWVTRKANAIHSREAVSRSTLRRRMLQPEEVREIKTMLGEKLSMQKIADIYGCSRSSILHISKGRTWSHV